MHTGIRQPAKDKKQVGEKMQTVLFSVAWTLCVKHFWMYWMTALNAKIPKNCVYIYIVQFFSSPYVQMKNTLWACVWFCNKKKMIIWILGQRKLTRLLSSWLKVGWIRTLVIAKGKIKEENHSHKTLYLSKWELQKQYRRESTQRIKRIPAPQKHSNQSTKLVATMTVP